MNSYYLHLHQNITIYRDEGFLETCVMKRVINLRVESVAYFKHFSEKRFGPITLIVVHWISACTMDGRI